MHEVLNFCFKLLHLCDLFTILLHKCTCGYTHAIQVHVYTPLQNVNVWVHMGLGGMCVFVSVDTHLLPSILLNSVTHKVVIH